MAGRSYERKIAQQLTLSQARRLSDQDRFWSVEFLAHFADRVDELRCDDPSKSLAFARELDGLIDRIEQVGRFDDAASAKRWRLYGRLVLASSCRAADLYEEARFHFDWVGGLLPDPVDPWLAGHFNFRLGVFLAAQDEPAADSLLENALRHFEDAPPAQRHRGLAIAYNARGVLRYHRGQPESVVDFARALQLFDRGCPAQRKRFDIAQANLFMVMCEVRKPGQCARALNALIVLRREMANQVGLRAIYVRWAEARLRVNLGLYEDAAPILERLRAGILKRSSRLDFALISLDLMIVYAAAGRAAELSSIRADTLSELRRRPGTEMLVSRLASVGSEATAFADLRSRWQRSAGKPSSPTASRVHLSRR